MSLDHRIVSLTISLLIIASYLGLILRSLYDSLVGRVPRTECADEEGVHPHRVALLGEVLRKGPVVIEFTPSCFIERHLHILKGHRHIDDGGRARLVIPNKNVWSQARDLLVHSLDALIDANGSRGVSSSYQAVLNVVMTSLDCSRVGAAVTDHVWQGLERSPAPPAPPVSVAPADCPV